MNVDGKKTVSQTVKKSFKYKYKYTKSFYTTLAGMYVTHAARQFDVPESTLTGWSKEHVSLDAKPSPARIFSENEEHQLVDHLKYMADIGYGYTKLNVQYLAADYAVSCGRNDPMERP
ncbi:hypothetical protein ACJMK2_000556 [Sinanodonta woodiana]|uniref:HTH psq-type domain-containing protein n=1 Tax=Sinanodonta woodiana TaxID=1069815 RepID=A0ABD3XQ41_SINWO